MGVAKKYRYDDEVWRRRGHAEIATYSHDWSDTNPPWDFDDIEEVIGDWPEHDIVDLDTTVSSDFYTQLLSTVVSAAKKVVVRLPAGVHHLNQFRPAGSSGNPAYAFGFWHPNLQGLLGEGATETIVQLDADSYTQEQLDKLGTMNRASFDPLQAAMIRLDGSQLFPVLIGAVGFRAADQQHFTSLASDLSVWSVVQDQPASHQGVFIYGGSQSIISHCRFQAAGAAATSAPPFECANITTGRGWHVWRNCEFDGRRAPELDPAQPRRCGPIMANSEFSHEMVNCWMHHSNVSRYAVNDQNRDTAGEYIVRRCKIEEITNTQNTDPNLNGGASLGGYTNASPFGWESLNASILIDDTIVSQDNDKTAGQVPCHFQLTSVGNRNPQGGRFTVLKSDCRSTKWPSIDGYITFRIQPNTYWWIDEFETTLNVLHEDGHQLEPYVVTGTYPPTAASLTAAGVSPDTHYLVRST